MTWEATPAAALQTSPATHIGAVAARTELSLRSLRHWDEVGLLKASGRTLGFTLAEMSAAMRDIETLQAPAGGERDVTSANERLHDILRGAVARRETLVRQLAMAEEFIDLLGRVVV